MKHNLQRLKQLIKFDMPVSVTALLLIPLYGYFNPWPPATRLLQSYPGQSLMLVGVSYKASYATSGSNERQSRSYVLFPSVFSTLKTVTITKVNSEPPSVGEHSYGFLRPLIWFVIGLVGTWWCWFRKRSGSAVQAGIQHDGSASDGSAG